MKNFVVILLVSVLTACGSGQNLGGSYRDTYGLLDKDEIRNKCVIYDPIVSNAVWSFLLSTTIIVPIWLIGFRLWEPVSVKAECMGDLF